MSARRIRRLHGLDMALVGMALLLALSLLCGLIYAMPSFFTPTP